MGDSYLEDIAEKLCSLRPAQFSHLLAHRKPSKEKKIGNLIFLDATQLYRHENLSNCFSGLSISSVNLEQSKQLLEKDVNQMNNLLDKVGPMRNLSIITLANNHYHCTKCIFKNKCPAKNGLAKAKIEQKLAEYNFAKERFLTN